MTRDSSLNAEDFKPALKRTDGHLISRPSLSYWQDAWHRLQKNKRALASLYLIVTLLFFTLFGPLLWSVDPAQQDLDHISQGPSLGRLALIIHDESPWQEIILEDVPEQPEDFVDELGAPDNLQIIGRATTQFVRLRWDPVEGAAGYLIYRNDHEPINADDLGLPLGENFAANQVSFEDRLQLQARNYYYSIIATDGFDEALVAARINVNLVPAITQRQARERGLDAKPGDQVRLEAHPFGTDYLGRDMLARIIAGARISLFIGLVAPFIYVCFGTFYGGISGYFGGNVDHIMMRLVDFVLALPFLLFMILFKIAFGIGPGESGILPMLAALVLLRWPDTARVVRGQILQIREESYIQASRLLGATPFYLIVRHMIPNTLGTVLVTLTFAIPLAIFTEAFLSFIGMGVVPPTPSWGSMSNEGLKSMLTSPHELFFPALFISMTVLAFNLLGDGLRDALDSRLRSRE